MSDEERFRLTQELWMLWQMRYLAGGPLVSSTSELVPSAVLNRELYLARRLGYEHILDRRPP